MRLFLECTPDETLALLVGVPRRMIVHSHSKGRVSKALARNSGVTGLVDEDPGEPEPTTLSGFIHVPEASNHDLKLKVDKLRNNRLVIISPSLEPWLIKTAKAADLKMESYNLSENPRDLHRNIILRLPKMRQLVDELLARKSPRLLYLKSLLLV